MPSSWDSIWYNANVATMLPDVQAYGMLRDGAVCVRQGLIGWIGPTAALPANTAKNRYIRRSKFLLNIRDPGIV